MSPFIKNPKSNRPDPMLTIVVLIAAACTVKFLFEGVSFDIMGHTVNLGHADPLTYGAMLGPTLGAHSYMHVKGPKKEDGDVNQN